MYEQIGNNEDVIVVGSGDGGPGGLSTWRKYLHNWSPEHILNITCSTVSELNLYITELHLFHDLFTTVSPFLSPLSRRSRPMHYGINLGRIILAHPCNLMFHLQETVLKMNEFVKRYEILRILN